MFLKTGRKRVARVRRARDQDARIRERAALLGERIRQRLGDELVGHERRYDASLFQRLGRDAADRGDRGGREYARREPPGDEPIEHDVHGVLLVNTTHRYAERPVNAARNAPRFSSGWMRITGASTASAPRASSARTSSPACSRARVTTIRRPCNPPTLVMRCCNLTVALPIINQCFAHCALR